MFDVKRRTIIVLQRVKNNRASLVMKDSDGRRRLAPSVIRPWRDSGCKSHFIVCYGLILLFDSDESEIVVPDSIAEQLVEKLKDLLSDEPANFRDLARILGTVPWDVNCACRRLVGMGYAVELGPKRRGFLNASSRRGWSRRSVEKGR